MSSVENKIIEVLQNYGELNVTKISKLTGISFKTLDKYLKKLLKEGVIEERRFGRLRLLRLRKKV
ncbi:MAG: winged helix-turn-helix transcriptional regulator [Desulfurococcaceae archaeon]|uniref:Winged helix-turn-helix transcriptional regulator n=1 Tax=Staphylothermus marinus TaxID=2280 RepID=A0A7C4JLF0_STAMA